MCYVPAVGDGDREKSRRDARKERVLHTRVPAVLEHELKRVANAWRVPVSNVVRALLEDALDTLDLVGAKAEDELREVAAKLASERRRIRRRSAEQLTRIPGTAPPAGDEPAAAPLPQPLVDPLQGAIGVTQITLVQDAVCGVTGEHLTAGSEAYVVLFDQPSRQLIAGRNALPSASTANEEKTDD
jgi:hypothetical protein